MITGFHHTGIVVRDLESMVRFYTEVIGLEKLMELDSVAPPEGDHTGVPGARRKLVFVGYANDHQIELVHYFEPRDRGGRPSGQASDGRNARLLPRGRPAADG